MEKYLFKKRKSAFYSSEKVICSEEIEPNLNLEKENSKKLQKIKNSEIFQKAFINFKYFNKYSKKCIEKRENYVNPHSFYDEIEKRNRFKSISEKVEKEAKIKETIDKKRFSSMSPIEAVKSKLFSNKIKKDEIKVNEKKGIGFEKQKINLNLIKINEKIRKLSGDDV